jgi:AcrR family transcriptional regulator
MVCQSGIEGSGMTVRQDPGKPPATRHGSVRRKFDLPLVVKDVHPTAMKLLDAAWTVLERSGWKELSFYAIGQEAGVSPSLVWYHFGSKSELLVVLADWIFHNELDNEVWRNATSGRRPEDPWELLTGQCKGALLNSRSYQLYFDMLPHLLDEQGTRARLAENHRNLAAAMASALSPTGTDPSIVEANSLLATLTTAMTDGLAIQLLADPDCVDIEEALALWKECVEGLLQRRAERVDRLSTSPETSSDP